MTEYTRSRGVDAPAEQLFEYLSDVRNLPRYFSGMTSAEAGPGPDQVSVTAEVQGEEVAGTAKFQVDEAANRIEWSSDGPNSYHGWLSVRGRVDGSEVEVHVTTEREADEGEIEAGLERTLREVVRLVGGRATSA